MLIINFQLFIIFKTIIISSKINHIKINNIKKYWKIYSNNKKLIYQIISKTF